MFQLVGVLSEIKGVSIPELLELYGEHFFGILAKGYPQFLLKNNLIKI